MPRQFGAGEHFVFPSDSVKRTTYILPPSCTSVLVGRQSLRTPSWWSGPSRLAGSASGVSRPRAATRVANFELDDVCRQIATQVKKIFIDTLLVQTLHTLASPNL